MPHDLTPRETEVIRLLSLGCSNIETAKILGVTPATTDTHKMHAVRKLGVTKSALLTRLAIKLRISSMKDTLTPAEKRKIKRKRDGWN